MRVRDRIVWIGSWVAPVAWVVAAVLLAVVVARPELGETAGGGRIHAWLLGVLALGAAAHLLVVTHGHFHKAFSHDERAQLRFKLALGAGHGHWRRLMRQHHESQYGGRSHSGERPHYD